MNLNFVFKKNLPSKNSTMMKFKTILLVLMAYGMKIQQIDGNPIGGESTIAVEFIVLHNNDMHGRFEQTNANSGKCASEDAKNNKCYGGFARTAHVIREFREKAKAGGTPVIYLNAGDTYTGTPWFAVFKDNITAKFMNELAPDAMSLGNHEFDEGVEGLIPFLNQIKYPVVAANLDLSKTPTLAAAKNLVNSTILTVNNVKIGVIGYLTPYTKHLNRPNTVEYFEEIECINNEAKKLTKSGINIIIALGHSGFQKDQEIAKNCPEVDLVIGGHTNTFLYNGDQPDLESIAGPYPQIVTQLNGKIVPVVQAYAYTKYLGKLHLQFDKNGNLINFEGQPMLLNSSIERDADILELLEVYRPKLIELETNIVGRTKVLLEGSAEICRKEECNLGNMIADSMVYARVKDNLYSENWTDAAIAFIQGGGIRNTVVKNSEGTISENDVLSILPFHNELFITQLSAKQIFDALERSISSRSTDSNGGFLQMSGIKVIYDLSKNEGERVSSVMALCTDCQVPSYQQLNQSDSNMYNVIVSTFLLNGGDGHYMNSSSVVKLKDIDSEILSQYIRDRQIVYPGIEGRITFLNAPTKGGASFSTRFSVVTISLAFIFRLLIS